MAMTLCLSFQLIGPSGQPQKVPVMIPASLRRMQRTQIEVADSLKLAKGNFLLHNYNLSFEELLLNQFIFVRDYRC